MPVSRPLRRLFGAVILSLSGIASAAVPAEIPYQPIPGASAIPVVQGAGLRTRADLEAFIDGVMADQLLSHELSGAVVSVVKGGEIFFTKGYGYADREKQVPMSGKSSLIRPGSVSKLFAWTAVMQLVERGLVDLDTDVNTYLTSLQIPDTFDQPITLRNLLTHTPGLEDGGVGYLMAESEADLQDMATFLEEHMPARVRPPTTDFADGRNASYSNWGTALAGVIVADVTGVSFDEYIEKNIFKPLGMKNSTFREPLPATMAKDMAVGYKHKQGVMEPGEFEFIHNFGPAGSMTSTASDMARFMIAHLQNGRYGDTRILKADTAKLMHSRQLSPNVHVNGAALGFYESWVNGRRLIAHGGDTGYFHSDLNLLKGEGVGLFVSYSSASTLPIRSRAHLLQAFMDRYYPATLPRVTAPDDFQKRAAEYAGSYRHTRMSYTKIEKVFSGFSAAKVIPTENNTLLITGLLGPTVEQYVEVAPDTFRAVDREEMVAFMRDESGQVTHLSIPLAFIAAYRLSFYETPEFNMALILAALIAAIGAVVGWFNHRGQGGARPVAALAGGLVIAALVMLAASVMALMEDPIAGFTGIIHIALALIIVALLTSLWTGFKALSVWADSGAGLWFKLRYTATAVIFLALMIMFNYWNLIGWHFG